MLSQTESPSNWIQKNFEKVRNACKNAISQRKEKTLDKEASQKSNLTSNVKNSVARAVDTINRSCTGQYSEDNVPSAKRQKLPSTKELKQDDLCENNATVASRSSDSEDGLTKLMKDFQSAMESPSIKENLKANSTQKFKDKLRYISKKTSRHLPSSKSASSSTSNVKSNEIEDKAETTCSTTSVFVSSELNTLQTEDISSDEDFESSQEVQMDTSASGSFKIGSIKKEKLTSENEELSIKFSEANLSPSKGQFLVVDEVGFTPDDSSSSQGIFPPVSEGQRQTLDTSCSKVLERNVSAEGKSTPPSPVNDMKAEKCSSKHGYNEHISDLKENKSSHDLRLKRPLVETKVVEEQKKLKVSVGVAVTSSQLTQTEDAFIEKKEKASSATLKPEVKDQSVQFRSEIDPEEITPIVTAIFESECEEKERLKKALDDKIGKEEKWRNMVKDLCRQLRELRQQLAKKEEKNVKNVGMNTVTETSALPVIISTQATQTDSCESPGFSCPVSTKAETSHCVEAERTIIQSQTLKTVLPSSEKMGTNDQSKIDPVTTAAQVIVLDARATHSVQNIGINLTTSLQSQSAPNGVGKDETKVTMQPSAATEVIDLTESEDVIPVEAQANKSPVQSRQHVQSTVYSQVLPTTCQQKPLTMPSKPNILQSNSKSPSKDQPQTIITRPVTSQPGFLSQVPSLRSLQSEKNISSVTRMPAFTIQNVQRTVPNNRQLQNQLTSNSITRSTALQGVTQVVASQQRQAVPPPLQPAPTITGTIYNKPQTSQLPLLSPIGNLSMIVRAQAPPRQDVVLSGVSQQVVQHHGLIPQQQSHIKNAILIEEFNRGQLAAGIPRYQGPSSIILPNSPHQVTNLPIRLPQVLPQAQSTLQSKRGMLEKKRMELQQQLQQAYQLKCTQKRMEITRQLQAVLNELNEVDENEKAHMQGYRNFKVAHSVSSPAHRFQAPPSYSATLGTTAPVGHVITSTVRPQSINTSQQREVVNGIKHFVPLTSLSSQPTNALHVVNGRAWLPSSRQGGEAYGKLIQGNPAQHVINVNSRSPPNKHPAALPTLRSSISSVEKGSLLPSPSIRISHSPEGVVLSWNITTSQSHPTVKKYFLYAYQVLNTPPNTSHWKRIGEVGALPPPMACTLNQFQPGSTYFLAICAVDVYDRPGLFSKTEEVVIPN